MTVKACSFIENFGSTLKGLAKIVLQSRACNIVPIKDASIRPLILLANGPSLKNTIDKYSTYLAESDTLAVNFAANAPEFRLLRPKYYVLADPHFFTAYDDINVVRLVDNLRTVDWDMVLLLDCRFAKRFINVASLPQNVSVMTFNAVGVEGFAGFENFVFSHGLAMPRPRNVLIPALMSAIKLGYKQIYICGADHSWLRDLSVGEDNIVASGLNHFYKESDREASRVQVEYRSYRLHDIIYSLFVAFRSYHTIERFARHEGVDIYNSTKGSYIDAFRRMPLPFNIS